MPDTLMSALEHWEQRWVDLGVDTRPLRRGLPAAQISEQLAAVGIPPHPALIDWFSWHDGSDDLAFQALACPMGPITLDRALNVRVAYMEPAHPDDTIGFEPTWCPILGGLSTDTIALDGITGELFRIDAWNAEDSVRSTGAQLRDAISVWHEVLNETEVQRAPSGLYFVTLPPHRRQSPLL